jgi:hypothetical protein
VVEHVPELELEPAAVVVEDAAVATEARIV